MIQKNYRLSLDIVEDRLTTWVQLNSLLNTIEASRAYREASGVYILLLCEQIPKKYAQRILDLIHERLPKAVVTGMSQTIFARRSDGYQLDLNISFFREARVTLIEHHGCPCHYGEMGTAIGKRLRQMDNVKAVSVFCAGLTTAMSGFIDNLAVGNEEVAVFGAVAGIFEESVEEVSEVKENLFHRIDASPQGEQYIIGSKVCRSGIIMAVFSGAELFVRADYILGWKPLGKEMTVTETKGETCIVTVDNIPATEIYHRYLKVTPDENFIFNIAEFPLGFLRNDCIVARVPPVYDEEGGIYFNGDVHLGEKVRLMYANPHEILAITKMYSEEMHIFSPEAAFLTICGNRTLFLKQKAAKEPGYYRRFRPDLTEAYGTAEIYKHQGQGGVLNSAFVAVGMREGTQPTYSPWRPKMDEEEETHEVIPLSTRMAAFLDATTRELAESNEGLKQMAEQAKAANIAKSQFLSNMSHEIRTPINAVLGMDEMILRECHDPVICEYAENIRLAGNSLLSLVNDILDFSKIEAGKMDIIPVEYEMSSVLNDLVNMIQTRAQKKGLALKVDAAPCLPSVLFGDEVRIKQVVTNILTNAVKYTEKGSIHLTVDYEKEDAAHILLKISVKDTGIGIKEEDIARLFTAFERIEEKRNRAIEGTGLGMNITQQLLSLMGSKLAVKSVYGEGSDFSFKLRQEVMNWEPMGDFAESYRRTLAKRGEYQEKFIAPNACILVVDDTVMNITVVKGLLKQTRVQIDTAESGYECLHLVTKKHYDIIFLDHRMPGIDGIETLARMKALPGNLNDETPVISLTANAVSGAKAMYMEAGFQDYLTKPINSTLLETMMLKYLPPEKVRHTTEAVAPEEETVLAALPDWLQTVPGLDTAAGVGHCGSEDAYLDALTVFAESIEPSAAEIEEYFRQGDYANYTTKVHALKSSARVVGATELSEKALRLENAGNSGYVQEIEADTPALLALYRSYAPHLSPLLQQEDTDSEEKPLIDPAELSEAYETLREITASFDFDSLQFVMDSLAGYRLPETETERYAALKKAAREPDWIELAKILA
ncbi:MAG: response regulator [Selenomonadaceae bacterium]|nr:response regulator [Selenomonadaceae bacterium]